MVNKDKFQSKRIFSRTYSAAALITASALVLTGCAASGDSSQQAESDDLSSASMVYASYGGTTEEYTTQAWGDPFQERTIEVEERGEEAVVSKEARVVEEVVVRKEADQRTETISDTVRKTEVDVEDERSVRGTGTTGSTDGKR